MTHYELLIAEWNVNLICCMTENFNIVETLQMINKLLIFLVVMPGFLYDHGFDFRSAFFLKWREIYS